MSKLNIEVKLVGVDGNAFMLIGTVCAAMRKHKVPAEQVKEFQSAAFGAGSYDDLLVLIMEWVDVT